MDLVRNFIGQAKQVLTLQGFCLIDSDSREWFKNKEGIMTFSAHLLNKDHTLKLVNVQLTNEQITKTVIAH